MTQNPEKAHCEFLGDWSLDEWHISQHVAEQKNNTYQATFKGTGLGAVKGGCGEDFQGIVLALKGDKCRNLNNNVREKPVQEMLQEGCQV